MQWWYRTATASPWPISRICPKPPASATELMRERLLITVKARRRRARQPPRIESGDAEPSSFAGSNHSELTYRPGGDRAYERTVAYVSEEIARAEEARIEEARKPETFWTAPFWKHPIMKVLSAYFAGGGSSSGFNSEPRNWH
jgi:hypothetical protein